VIELSFWISGVMMPATDNIQVLMTKYWHVVGLAIGMLVSTGCEKGEQAVAVEEAVNVTPSEGRMRLWANSCALCHVTGVGGAPIVGKHDDWADRLKQGSDVLLQHTLEGYNNMPPLGYCMACEKEDFSALIEFMAAGTP